MAAEGSEKIGLEHLIVTVEYMKRSCSAIDEALGNLPAELEEDRHELLHSVDALQTHCMTLHTQLQSLQNKKRNVELDYTPRDPGFPAIWPLPDKSCEIFAKLRRP